MKILISFILLLRSVSTTTEQGRGGHFDSFPTVLPSWKPTYQMNKSTFVYTCNYTGPSDVSNTSILAKFGMVFLDWSESKEIWVKESPMTCSETLLSQAKALRLSNPTSKIFLYSNIVKALPWMIMPRLLLESENASSMFLTFKSRTSPSHSARCDMNFMPPKCSDLYHDQVQTPQFPTNNRYDGTCNLPCNCGKIPCGEYLWDVRSEAVRDYIVNDYIFSPYAMGSGIIDGVSLDDAWVNETQQGSNSCTGSPFGGPSEIDSFCWTDIGLTQEETVNLTNGWSQTVAAVNEKVNAAGGMTMPQFTTVSTPANDTSQCAAFFQSACGSEGIFQSLPILHSYSEAPGRIFSPIPYFMQDLATFLLIRGDFAWLGFNWNGCSYGANPPGGRYNQSWTFPDPLNIDYGIPLSTCTQNSQALNVFERNYSKSHVSFDCNKWTGSVVML